MRKSSGLVNPNLSVRTEVHLSSGDTFFQSYQRLAGVLRVVKAYCGFYSSSLQNRATNATLIILSAAPRSRAGRVHVEAEPPEMVEPH